MRTDNPWTVTSTKTVYQNPWIKVREDAVVTPTGKQSIYGVMESNDSVMVAALNENDELYLVRAFRYPDSSWGWELPGGGGDKQDPITASKRELEEETGIVAKSWERLGETLVCNGLMTERMTTYLAYDLSFDGTKESADEQIDEASRFFSMDDIDTMINHGEINDSQSITGIHLAQKWLTRNR